mmetsp:Transcript_70974/g.179630  ORF Transcript_70974/g.179630 Transcript_70974/m.179630 type:complete len:286 (+) Transcript_70974:747-1604(+)
MVNIQHLKAIVHLLGHFREVAGLILLPFGSNSFLLLWLLRLLRLPKDGGRSAERRVRLLGEVATTRDHHGLRRLARQRRLRLDFLNNLHTSDHTAEHDVLAIKPRSRLGGDEKLRAVGVGTRICHRQHPGTRMGQREVLVGKPAAIDALPTRASALGEVSALAHEVVQYSVEGRALEIQGLARDADASLPGTETPEVLGSPWRDIPPQLQHHPANCLPADGDIQKHLRVAHGAATAPPLTLELSYADPPAADHLCRRGVPRPPPERLPMGAARVPRRVEGARSGA